MSHTSSKLIELGSTAFRQPRAESHCRYIHGYQLKAEITFACNELDDNNWVFDFGGLKDLKHIYKTQFDHTLVVAKVSAVRLFLVVKVSTALSNGDSLTSFFFSFAPPPDHTISVGSP